MNKDLEHTQPLPRLSPDGESQKTQLLNVSRVRELEPVEIPRRQSQQEPGQMPGSPARAGYGGMGNSGGFGRPQGGAGGAVPGQAAPQKKRGLMAVLLVACFLVAAFCGAALSGYMSEQQAKKAALDSQQAAASRQMQEADSQQAALSREKARLEEEYQKLLAEQKEAQSAADKLKGQKEQQEKLQKEKSAAGKVLDKITGDAGKQKQEENAVAGREAEARQKLEAISQSVQEAGAAIDEVNAQLDNLDAVRHQAQQVKADVDRAYSENKDAIDAVLHYVTVGLNALFK